MQYRSLKKATLSSFAWKLLERGGNQFIQLVVQIAMARLLTPEVFGSLAILLVFVNLGNVIVQSGLNTALIQAEKIDDDDCSTVFWLSFGISVLLYCAIYLSAPVVASFFALPDLVWPLRVLCVVLPLGSLNSVQIAIVQRNLSFRKVFYATIGSVLLSGLFGVIFALIGCGLWALVAQQLLYQICNCSILLHFVEWRPARVFNAPRACMLFKYGWKLLVSGLLDQGYQSLSDIIVGRQFSASSLGLVSQGKKYPQALGNMLDGAIQPVMLAAVARIQADRVMVKRLVSRALKMSTYLIVPTMTFFAVAAGPLVALVLGNQWLECVPFIQMYCFVYALLPIQSTNLQALNGMGRSDVFLKLELIKKGYGVVCLLFAAFVFRDVYLLVGSYMLTGVVSTFVNSYPNKKLMNYSYLEQLRDIAPAFAMSAVAGGCAWLITYVQIGSAALTILLQLFIVVTLYILQSIVFRSEAFVYFKSTVRELLGFGKGKRG